MASVRDVVGGVLAKLKVHDVQVVATRDLAPRFRLFELHSKSLRGAPWSPGDKLQLLLDGGARTYTPFAFDSERGTLSVLVFVHGDTPGSVWGREAKESDALRVFGPRGSIALASLDAPVVFFGDETSFGCARALLDTHKSGGSFVFEVAEPDIAAQVLGELGIKGAQLVKRREGDGHLVDIERHLSDLAARTPRTSIVLTGRAPAIQQLRTALKARSLSTHKTKAYWAPGKRGLD